ncbi:MAG: TonB-dependent receptor [Woeseiaceae bacterium]|nr:TonB-dependent receptor [Woeseiaceae bacterium]
MILRAGFPSLLSLSLASLPALAQDVAGDAAVNDDVLDTVTIIGKRQDIRDVPGSAHVVDAEELETFLAADILRVLRNVPGVYVQEEDGFGLRPNIGIRGSGLDRSSRVALLEDGVLIAPAPYASPSAYYFPTQRRMHSIEVLKGPASVPIGPRTTGGAVNLISTPIPDAFAGHFDLRLGENSLTDAHAWIGDRGTRFSWLVETVQSQTDGFKRIDRPDGARPLDSGFDIGDYVVKLQLDSDPGAALYQSLRFKGGYTDQVSDETYLGLTDADFRADPYRRYAASAEDVFDGEHEQLQLTYVLRSENHWSAEVTAYRNDFARDWFKLQSVNGTGIGSILDSPEDFATEYAWITGSDSPDDAIVNRHNNREYYSTGVQGSVSWDLSFGETDVRLTTGLRVHEDEEDRFQWEDSFRMEDGRLVQTSAGVPGSQANRVGRAEAVSTFIDTEIRAGRWILTPGLRFEDIDTTRLDFSTADPARAGGPTRVRNNSVSVLIPGMGVLYRASDNWRLLAGVHKGFNPPAPGSSASEEDSLNVEIGTRFDGDRTSFEAIWFVNDYDNLVGTVTASTGGSQAIGEQFDGGEVTVQGLELSAAAELPLPVGDWRMPLSLQYTWTAEAEFDSSFESSFDPWGDVEAGDELPYIPAHQLRATAALESERFSLNLAASYVDDMRSVAGSGPIPVDERIGSHVVWDALARWNFNDRLSSYVKVDNLFDEVYEVSRRPAGLRPGLDRTAYIVLSYGLSRRRRAVLETTGHRAMSRSDGRRHGRSQTTERCA